MVRLLTTLLVPCPLARGKLLPKKYSDLEIIQAQARNIRALANEQFSISYYEADVSAVVASLHHI